MSNSTAVDRFTDDTRGVSAVVGAILMFGILILALTTYQAAIVPQQNAQTEFEHFEDNRDELIEFRNAVSTAGQTKTSQFPSVKLGTQYQSRTFTINPAPPSGTLQTSKPYNITISDTNGNSENVSTRFVEYRPEYREISVGSTWFEHSVLYLDERESSGQNIIQDQNIVTSSGTIRITALQNEFQSTRTDRVTVELYPTNDSDFPEFDGEVTVKLPTRLDETDYWGDEIGDHSVYERVESYPGEPDVNRLVLKVDSDDDLEMNTVGIQDEPTEDSVNNVPDRGSGENGGNEGTEVNPAGPNDVRLVGVQPNDDNEFAVDLTFENGGENTAFTEGRVGFIFVGAISQGKQQVDTPRKVTAIEVDADDRLVNELDIGGNFGDFDPNIQLDGEGEKTTVTYVFDEEYNTERSFFVTTLRFEDGDRATYFVGGEFGS